MIGLYFLIIISLDFSLKFEWITFLTIFLVLKDVAAKILIERSIKMFIKLALFYKFQINPLTS